MGEASNRLNVVAIRGQEINSHRAGFKQGLAYRKASEVPVSMTFFDESGVIMCTSCDFGPIPKEEMIGLRVSDILHGERLVEYHRTAMLAKASPGKFIPWNTSYPTPEGMAHFDCKMVYRNNEFLSVAVLRGLL